MQNLIVQPGADGMMPKLTTASDGHDYRVDLVERSKLSIKWPMIELHRRKH